MCFMSGLNLGRKSSMQYEDVNQHSNPRNVIANNPQTQLNNDLSSHKQDKCNWIVLELKD